MNNPIASFPDNNSLIQVIFLVVVALVLLFIISKIWHILVTISHYLVPIIVILILISVCLCLALLIGNKSGHPSLPPAQLVQLFPLIFQDVLYL